MARRQKATATTTRPTPPPATTAATDLRERILADFAALKVPLRAEQFDAVLAEAVRDGLSHQQFLHRLIEPEYRKQFLANPEPLFESAGLTEEERDMVRRRDWRAMIHYGVIFFMLEKLGAVIGTTNLHIYAAMRGQSLEDFQKTRNAKVLYSVAGKDEGKKDWDSPGSEPD